MADSAQQMKPTLLAISYRFPPDPYPLSSRVETVLSGLSETWSIHAITASDDATANYAEIHHVPSRAPYAAYDILRKLRLRRLEKTFILPDRQRGWIKPATTEALRLIAEHKPDAVLVFAMPFSCGVIANRIKRESNIPVVLNLNDAPTCSDMWPVRPSKWHYKYAQKLETSFAENADAVIYVSEHNLERARQRLDDLTAKKLHLVRRAGVANKIQKTQVRKTDVFTILYTGTMVGWAHFRRPSFWSKFADLWRKGGMYRLVEIDFRSHSPVYIGKAVKDLVTENPDWNGRIEILVVGNNRPRSIIEDVLAQHDLQDIVTVRAAVPQKDVQALHAEADLLFLALPDRKDSSPGGRIAAKTYDYLSTDKPILAALPAGENRNYLAAAPGVFITDPFAVEAMKEILNNFITAKFDGRPTEIDRRRLREELNAAKVVGKFQSILEDVLERKRSHAP